MSLRREREKERLMQNFEYQLFWVSSTRGFSICRLVVTLIMFVLQIDTTFPLEKQSEVTWASKSVTITTISWDSSRQAIPRRVLSSVCRSYLETALLPSSLMALRPLLHPHRPLCPMRFYPPTPVSFLHFVHNLPPLSLSFSFLRLFIRSASFFSVFLRVGTAACVKEREGRREEGKKLESNRFLNGHRNYFLPDSTKEKKKWKKIWKKCGCKTRKRCVFECGLWNEMRARCVWRYPVYAITFLKTKVT